MLEGVWGCSAGSVPVALGMCPGMVPRVLECFEIGSSGFWGYFSGSVPGVWERALGLIPRAFGMLDGVRTQGFWNVRLGESLSRESIPIPAGHGGEEEPLFPPLPCSAGKFGLSLLFSVSQPRPLMLLAAPMIMRKVELAPLLRCDGCRDKGPIMAAIAAAR